MRLNLATVVRATEATVHRVQDGAVRRGELSPGDLQSALTEVTVDSRTVVEDGLFVALPGERVDGHDFVAAALAAGARACLVQHLPENAVASAPDDQPRYLLEVPDPLAALQQLAASWRRASDVEMVGVTGSIGKTTTKEILASVLGAMQPVLKSEANLNTEIGLPLMLLRLRPEHRVAVLEMGMYLPGDIRVLARLARPRIGIVTNVAPIHLERAGSIERIARGKSELVAELPAQGLAVLNGDNEWTRAMAVTSGIARAVLVGFASDCDYRAENVKTRGLEGISFTIRAEGKTVPVQTSVPGRHTIHAFLAAAATARELGISWTDITGAIAQARLDVRQRIVQRDGLLIIDDSYNAAPMSVSAALELLRESPGIKIAVLGDMLELGPGEEAAHRLVGAGAAAAADWLVARGARSAWIAEAARESGMRAERIRCVADNDAAVQATRAIMETTDGAKWSVLVKGSRGMRMEEVVVGLESLMCPSN
jgi:UDP-N-acetylmuramoyl-tripeptide--D-alanyl-D-alanine ligase